MRVLLLSMAVLCVASCSPPQVPGATVGLAPPIAERPVGAAESAPYAAAKPPGPGVPVALMPEPVAVAPEPVMAATAPPPAQGLAFPWPFPWPFAVSLPDPFRPVPPRLALSNFTYDHAHVEAVVTANADCDARDVGVYTTSEFDLAYDGTRVIEAPAGSDVCWRRALAGQDAGAAVPQWSRWSRAYLSAGRSVDSQL